MSRKTIVAIPLIMIARLASRPMISGKTNVAPNIATTCWAPMPMVRGQDSRSSGATASPSGGVFPSPYSFHPNAMTFLLLGAATIGRGRSPGGHDPAGSGHCDTDHRHTEVPQR